MQFLMSEYERTFLTRFKDEDSGCMRAGPPILTVCVTESQAWSSAGWLLLGMIVRSELPDSTVLDGILVDQVPCLDVGAGSDKPPFEFSRN